MAQTVKAVNGEMLQVTKCRNCKQNTAWRQSRRTGRWYLVKLRTMKLGPTTVAQ